MSEELTGINVGRGGGVVICPKCQDALPPAGMRLPVPVYRINVEPYRQTCYDCGQVLVKGTRGWPVLFDGSGPREESK